jgi:hypothetical protein
MILDADDMVLSDKIAVQANKLRTNNNLVAVYCKYQRFHHITKKLSPAYVGECTGMIRKSVLDKIGYYDSVRFGADTEFKYRLIKIFGNNKIYTSHKVMYYALNRPNSLTTTKRTGSGSVPRREYVKSFKNWHKSAKKLYMPFPLKNRPFPVNNIML